MRAEASTHPRHPDPTFRSRLYGIPAEEAVERFVTALGDLEGWRLDEEASGADRLVAVRRVGFPGRRERVALRLQAGDRKDVALLEARLTAEGPVAFAFQARGALRAVLWALDARAPQARDTPMRQLGYR